MSGISYYNFCFGIQVEFKMNKAEGNNLQLCFMWTHNSRRPSQKLSTIDTGTSTLVTTDSIIENELIQGSGGFKTLSSLTGLVPFILG